MNALECLVSDPSTSPLAGSMMDALFDAVYLADANRRVVSWNRGAEELTGYARDQVVGKSCTEDILLHIDATDGAVASGFCPAAETLADGLPRSAEIYIRHKRGHLIPAQCRVCAIRDADGQVVGVAEILRQAASGMLLGGQAMRDLAYLDPQTELASRAYLEMRLMGRLEERNRYHWEFGLILAQVDNLSDIAAQHGPEATSAVVSAVGKTFSGGLRFYDTVGRWEEDVLLAIVPVLRHGDLLAIGERIRRLVAESAFCHNDQPINVTVSTGVAAPSSEDSAVDLVRHAQQCLVASQSRGGNRVAVLPD